MRSQLLLTFSNTNEVDELISIIKETYNLVYKYIFILSNEEDEDELFVTYNIDTTIDYNTTLDNTIFVHRKKHTNTLYTINALNQLIREKNDGLLDKKYIINWDEYKNNIILVGENKPRIIKTEIYSVIDLDVS